MGGKSSLRSKSILDLRREKAGSIRLRVLLMVVYEFYCRDSVKEYELLAILPERRKDPRRITDASVMNWGKMLLGNNGSKKNIFYKKVTISAYTGKFFRVTPYSVLQKK